jgi:hypothetical protein
MKTLIMWIRMMEWLRVMFGLALVYAFYDDVLYLLTY